MAEPPARHLWRWSCLTHLHVAQLAAWLGRRWLRPDILSV
jgi:hypothetical protein